MHAELADSFMAAITGGDGRIARIEEYADTQGSDPLRELAATQRAFRA